MARFARLALLVPLLFAVLAVGLGTAPAASQAPNLDIDLSRRGLVLQSQVDPRWADVKVGFSEDVPMGRCGCFLAILSTVLDYEFLKGSPFARPDQTRPHFAVSLGPGPADLTFSPPYLHLLSKLVNAYKPRPGGTCAALPKLQVLELAGKPAQADDGSGNLFDVTPPGIFLQSEDVNGVISPTQHAMIIRNLVEGRPVMAGIKLLSGDYHMELIVGYDGANHQFRYVDPRWPTGTPAFVAGSGAKEGYRAWESSIVTLMEYKPVFGEQAHLQVTDDPAPYELLTTDPSGRRTGLDSATQTLYDEDPGGSYYELKPWADPKGTIPAGDREKFLDIRNPIDGTYRFTVVATGDGPLKLSFVTSANGTETVVQAIERNMTRGQTLKYELVYARSGGSTFAEVANLSPVARAGADSSGLTRSPFVFDGASSLDPDGAIVAYAWDFGDGMTSTDARATHAYETRGAYTARLTVTDDRGAASSDTVRVTVKPTDPIPPVTTADVLSAPNAAGWHNAPVTVTLSAVDNDGGSGVREITYSASGAAAIAPTTRLGAAAEITLESEGTTTLTFAAVDNDGSVEAAQTLELRLDRTIPTSEVVYPPDGGRLPVLNLVAVAADGIDAGNEDISALATLELSLRRDADGLFWDGASWTADQHWLAIDPAPRDGQGSLAEESLPAGSDLPDGQYTVRSRSADQASNVEEPAAGNVFTIGPVDSIGTLKDPLVPGKPGDTSFGADINAGDHVIVATTSFDPRFTIRGTLWRDGEVIDLGSMFPRAINDDDQIVGWAPGGHGGEHAVLWQDSAVTDLGGSCGGGSSAADINGPGWIVGYCQFFDSSLGRQVDHAVLWRNGEMQDLGTLGGKESQALSVNAAGQIVGWSEIATNLPYPVRRAFIWDNGTMRDLGTLGGEESEARAINAEGLVVGFALTADNDQHAFIWRDGVVQDLGPGIPNGLNASGQVVGTWNGRAVTWNAGVLTDLNALADPGPGKKLEEANAINDAGRIVGTSAPPQSCDCNDSDAFLLIAPGGGNPAPSDTIAPVTTAVLSVAPNAAGWHNAPVTVALNAVDNDGGSGVREIAHSRSRSGPVPGATAEFDIAAQGETSIRFFATDNAGNVERPAQRLLVRLDTQPPTTRADLSLQANSDGWHNVPVTVTLTATDPPGGAGIAEVTFRAEGAQPVADTTVVGATADLMVETDGVTTLTFFAKDAAGNIETEPQSVTIRLDRTPPVIAITSPEPDAQLADETRVIFSATDALSGPPIVAGRLDDGMAVVDIVNATLVNQVGAYTLNVEASDAAGNSATATRQFTIVPPPGDPFPDNAVPRAHAGGPWYTGRVGVPVVFDGSRSSDDDGDPLTYAWRFGDGERGPGVDPHHTYAEPGEYLVILVVDDGKHSSIPRAGDDSFALAIIRGSSVAPAVTLGDESIIDEAATFAGGGDFADPDSASWSATVDYGDGTGPQPLALEGSTFSLSHRFGDDGVFPVTVEVTDYDGAIGSGALEVRVRNVPPTVNAGGNEQLAVGQVFRRTASFTDPGADDWTAVVNYGDGAGPEPLSLSPDKSGALEHHYRRSGEQAVRICVADDDGGEGCAEFMVSVMATNQPPVCLDAHASVATIWPPNHKFVAISVLGVSDPDGDPTDIVITGIKQDEPVNSTGDGNFAPDGEDVGTATARVRAERTGTPKAPGNGRVYHIAFMADDAKGGQCTGEVSVAVPHDQKKPAIDGGALYDSTSVATSAAATAPAGSSVTAEEPSRSTPPPNAAQPIPSNKGSKKIELTVSDVTAQSLDATTMAAQVAGAKRGAVRVVFQIRASNGGDWSVVATDEKAPFRQVVDLANVEPGTYEVRAVAKGKGTDRSTSQPRRIAIPPNNASLESRDRSVEVDQPETEVSEGAADESPVRGDDRHIGDGRAEGSAAPSAPEVIADNANQGAESSRDHQDQKHKDRKHRGQQHERHGERRSR